MCNHILIVDDQPDRAAMPGWLLLDFGTDWCGHCIAARPAVDRSLRPHPEHVAPPSSPAHAVGSIVQSHAASQHRYPDRDVPK